MFILSDLRQMQGVTILREKRGTLKRETMTDALTGNERERELDCLQYKTCSCMWGLCLYRRDGRKISQTEIYTGKTRRYKNQTYWLVLKKMCFILDKSLQRRGSEASCYSSVVLTVRCVNREFILYLKK